MALRDLVVRPLPAALLALALVVPGASAQTLRLADRAALDAAASAGATAGLAPVPMAGPVDAERYRVGPGDVFLLSIYGPLQRETRHTVSVEGLLFMPETGPLEVSGRTLAEVRALVDRRLRGVLRGVGIQFQLVQPRRFIVDLTGEVRLRGPLVVTGGSRLSDVLPDSMLTERSSRRRIEVRSSDGTVRVVDLQRFRLAGEDGGDRPLADGDVVHVPVAREFVAAWGGVGRPGRLERGPADSLATLVRLAGGLRADAVLDRALLVRWRVATRAESLWVSLAGALGGPALNDGDELHVFVDADHHVSDRVEVVGRAVRTGTYPIQRGVTRLSEVLTVAGGLLPDGDSTAVELHRGRVVGGVADPEFERLSRLSRNEMTTSEYEIFRVRLASLAPEFRVDLRAVVRGGINDPVLRGGDVVVVPDAMRAVRVDGQVRRPGLIEYVPGKPWRYYLDQAGGFAARASRSKVRITRRSSGQTLYVSETGTPLPGDFLWVPERPEVNAWAYIKETIIVVAQLATIWIAIRN
ncbi:MAG: SLBB domain-containing protein [bacterium]